MSRYYPNPFIINSPIDEPELFVGRGRELEEIYQNLFGSIESQSVAIYGPYRLGKSSLLRYLGSHAAKDYFRQRAQERGQTEEENKVNRSVCVIVDLKLLRSHQGDNDFVTAFWRELFLKGIEAVKAQAPAAFNGLSEKMRQWLHAEEKMLTADDWIDCLHQLFIETTSKSEGDEKGLFFIFGLDHCEVIFELGEKGGYQVSQTLAVFRRSHRDCLAYVSAVPENLVSMERRFKWTDTWVDSDSPFYTGTPQVFVGLLLSQEESREVVVRPLEKIGAQHFLSNDEINLILKWGGYHPYLISAIAHTLFNVKTSERLHHVREDEQLRRQVHNMIYRFLQRIWHELGNMSGRKRPEGGFSQAQSAVIRIVCNLDLEPVLDEVLMSHLRERGVVRANGQKPQLFAGFFEDFVVREIIKVKPLDLEPEWRVEQREAQTGMRLIRVNGQTIEVTEREYGILYLLHKRPGRPISSREIAAEAAKFEGKEGSGHLLEEQVPVWMSRLRKRLRDAPVTPFTLEIVSFSTGYGIRYIQTEPQLPVT